jgi:hypothetical protein
LKSPILALFGPFLIDATLKNVPFTSYLNQKIRGRGNTGEIRFWRYLTDIGIFEGKIGARSTFDLWGNIKLGFNGTSLNRGFECSVRWLKSLLQLEAAGAHSPLSGKKWRYFI